ncbi:putative NeuA [Pedobacter sp. BAL39]|uniref:pseudaminic acid cytidylyltransferase n=1 Tax=Pedobacter sp. BAL39 TaxID=391596 RepID=UPI00015597F7|nr:pseudaminic acid cytidylyltransferase [Pedobacter sp. BAL39]EDM37187.1 putative NeuA [Pedobacter sp. BAL39]
MSSIAIIPARGGSKRIPRKNIIDFCGRPMIAHSIETALSSGLFSEVMVSTDDAEIADIAIKYGAKVPFFRSPQNSDDYATTADVLIEVLEAYEVNHRFFEYGCCIYPTAPLAQLPQLEKGFELLCNQQYDSVFPVVSFSYPVWRAITLDAHNQVAMEWPEYYNSRSQDLKKLYHDAGQWYWFNTNQLKDQRKLYMNKSFGLELQEIEVQDIDNMVDLKLAELKYKLLKS